MPDSICVLSYSVALVFLLPLLFPSPPLSLSLPFLSFFSSTFLFLPVEIQWCHEVSYKLTFVGTERKSIGFVAMLTSC